MNQSNNVSKNYNGFRESWEFILEKTKKPFPHTTFWVFFLFISVFLSGIGIFYELWNFETSKTSPVKIAFLLFTPPLINSAFFQILVTNKVEKNCKALIGGIAIIANFLFLYLFNQKNDTFSVCLIFLTAVLVIVALWLNWFQSSLNDDLYDHDNNGLGPNPTTTVIPKTKQKRKNIKFK